MPKELGTIDSRVWHEYQMLEVDRRKRRRVLLALAVLLIVALAAIPIVAPGAFNLDRYGVAIAYVLAAIGLNLAFGFAGELAIGFSAIMAAGAYSAGMMSAILGWNAFIVMPIAVALGSLFGVITMLPGLRVQGWYLALITLFSVLVVPHLVILGEAWTGGEYGLTGITGVSILGYDFSGVATFELIVASFALIWLLISNFIRSGWGYRLRALRDARRAAEAVGIDLGRTRLVVYALSSVPAASAGALLAYSQRFVNADAYNLSLTLLLLTGVVLGGLGTLWGPIVGMAPLLALSFWVGPFSQYNAVVLGFALLIGVLIFTNGFVPAFAAVAERFLKWSSRSSGSPEIAAGLAPPNEIGIGKADNALAPSQAATAPVVEVRGLVKRFGGVLALDHVDFRLERGRLCGLVGPNGSGKSTFLNTLSGFIRPDEGEIRIAGIDGSGRRPHEIARLGVGRTFQVPQLVDELTALENIEIGLLTSMPDPLLPALVHTSSIARRKRERSERALRALSMAGLPASSVRDPVEELSLGLKRTVEVARAVVASPTLLLLDEPAAGLSDEERHQLGELLLKLKEAGITILLVEHNVSFVMSICDEIALLESGRVTSRADLGGPLPDRLLTYLNFAPDRQTTKQPEEQRA